MNGQSLINYVRQHVRDIGYDNRSLTPDLTNNYAGRFWQDYEILLALNNAQMFILEGFLAKKDYEALSLLLNTIEYDGFTVRVPGSYVMPIDYYHYVNARVRISAENQWTIAKLYMGSDVLPYSRVRDDAVFITKDRMAGVYRGSYDNVKIQFNYLKYPTKIAVGEFNNSFTYWIYKNLIARYAAVILGQKELSTQRDFKNYKQVLNDMMNNYYFNAKPGALNDGPRNY